MRDSGKARAAAWRLIFRSLALLVGLLLTGVVARVIGDAALAVFSTLVLLWVGFIGFTLYFFRDPEARVPQGPGLIVAPAHGKVDVVDETTETEIVGGECQRISIFLSVFDVHVQNAPVGGQGDPLPYTSRAVPQRARSRSAIHNENVLLGFEASERRGLKVGVRLIAGVIARRIVPFVEQGDGVARGERIGLIQFGSRAEVYLPRTAQDQGALGDQWWAARPCWRCSSEHCAMNAIDASQAAAHEPTSRRSRSTSCRTC